MKQWAEFHHPASIFSSSTSPLHSIVCTATDSDQCPSQRTAESVLRSPVPVRLKMTPQGTAPNHSLPVVK